MNEKLTIDFNEVKTLINNLKSDKQTIDTAYKTVSSFNAGDNSSVASSASALANDLSFLAEKLSGIVTKTNNFETALEDYEDSNDNVDFAGGASGGGGSSPVSSTTPVAGKNNYIDNDSLKSYIEKNPILKNGTSSCMIYARERANLYYKEEYGSYFSDSRGITYAKDFDNTYRNLSGYKVSETPTVGSVMVFEANSNGAHSSGHAAFVEYVSPDGKTIIVSESNWGGSGIRTREIKNADTLKNVSYVTKKL